MPRLNQDRQKRLEPTRIETARSEIEKRGLEITYEDNLRIQFLFKGNKILYWAYSGWASGKGIKDGRGLKNLLNQLDQ